MKYLSCNTGPWRRAQRALARAGGCPSAPVSAPRISVCASVWMFQPSPWGLLSLAQSSSVLQPFLASAGRRVQELNQKEQSDALRITPGNTGHARDQRELQKSLRSTEDMTAKDSRISNNLSGKKQLSKLFSTHFKVLHTDLTLLPRQTFSV